MGDTVRAVSGKRSNGGTILRTRNVSTHTFYYWAKRVGSNSAGRHLGGGNPPGGVACREASGHTGKMPAGLVRSLGMRGGGVGAATA